LTSDELNAVKGRLKPLWVGNSSSAGSTVTPGSPQAGAASAPDASSHPATGGKEKFLNGKQRKSSFLKDNPGATSADWNSIKSQLEQKGIEPVDD
jgi:hypothetical protein